MPGPHSLEDLQEFANNWVELVEKKGIKKKGPEGPALVFCECGYSLVHVWTDGVIECANCYAELGGLVVVESDD